MTKGKKAFIIIAVVLFVAIAAFLYKRSKKSKDDETNNNKTNGTTSNGSGTGGTTSSITYTNDNFPLKKGSKGPRVKNLQKFLNWKGYNLTVDGYFGEKTAAALLNANNMTKVEQSYYDEWMNLMEQYSSYQAYLNRNNSNSSSSIQASQQLALQGSGDHNYL